MSWRKRFPGRTFANVGGVDLHYARYGKGRGPVVLFVHGMGDSHVNWRESAEMLSAKGFDCIALDLKGCGYSEKPERSDYSTTALSNELVGFLDALKIKKAAIAGVSYGGHLALRFGVLHPERVTALVICSAFAYVEPMNMPFEVTLARLPGLRSIAHWFVTHRSMVKAYRRWNFSAAYEGVLERVSEHWRFLSLPGGKRAYVRIMQGVDEELVHSFQSRYGSIKAPTLLVWGDADAFFPVAQGKRLERTIKNSRLEIIPGGSHLFMEESPATWVKHAAPFLARALTPKRSKRKRATDAVRRAITRAKRTVRPIRRVSHA